MDIFRRRRRNPYILPALVLLIAAAGGLGWYYNVGRSSDEGEGGAAPIETALPAASASAPVETHVTEADPVVAETPQASQVSVPAAAEPAPVVVAPEPIHAPVRPATAPEIVIAAPAPSTAATMPTFVPGTVMADAKRLMDAGDLLGARQALNPAITSGLLPADEQKLAMQLQEQLNKTLVFSPRRLPEDGWVDGYTIQPGDVLQRIAPKYAVTAKFIQRVNNINDPRRIRAGQTLKVIKGPFHAVVTKSAFTMDIYLGGAGGEGSLYVCTLPVGLGMDDSTPAGSWQVETGKKLVNPKYFSPRGGGVIEPDDPANPLGEFWIGLMGTQGEAVGKTSYGIHGTIEPASIGKMDSLGCIRMLEQDISLVYDMLVEGKSIVVIKP